MLTQERLKELLTYDKDTGLFHWVTPGLGKRKDLRAGSLRTDGYIQLRIDTHYYKAGRLAHLYVKGFFPEHWVTYINKNKSDNRWENLKVQSQVCCFQNQPNRSGLTGVHWFSNLKQYQVSITVGEVKLHLGYFKKKKDAIKARTAAFDKYYGGCK